MDEFNNQYQQPVQQPVYTQQPMYVQQPVVVQQQEDPTTKVWGIGGYIGTTILMRIPIVNFILWLVWVIKPSTNKNKKNFLLSGLIMFFIDLAVVLTGYFVLALAFGFSLDYLF